MAAHFCPKNMYEKLPKCPNFIWILLEHLSKYQNFYMSPKNWQNSLILHDFWPKNAWILHNNCLKFFFTIFFWGPPAYEHIIGKANFLSLFLISLKNVKFLDFSKFSSWISTMEKQSNIKTYRNLQRLQAMRHKWPENAKLQRKPYNIQYAICFHGCCWKKFITFHHKLQKNSNRSKNRWPLPPCHFCICTTPRHDCRQAVRLNWRLWQVLDHHNSNCPISRIRRLIMLIINCGVDVPLTTQELYCISETRPTSYIILLYRQQVTLILCTWQICTLCYSAVRIVFFFISNRIAELLFEISNRIVIVGLKSHQ